MSNINAVLGTFLVLTGLYSISKNFIFNKKVRWYDCLGGIMICFLLIAKGRGNPLLF